MRFKTHHWLFFNNTRFAHSSMVKCIKMLPREMVNRLEAYSSHMYLKRMHHLHVKDFKSMTIDFGFKSLVWNYLACQQIVVKGSLLIKNVQQLFRQYCVSPVSRV